MALLSPEVIRLTAARADSWYRRQVCCRVILDLANGPRIPPGLGLSLQGL